MREIIPVFMEKSISDLVMFHGEERKSDGQVLYCVFRNDTPLKEVFNTFKDFYYE